MKKDSTPAISSSLSDKLKTYSAMGAAFLAAAPSADAAIIYHDPSDVTISHTVPPTGQQRTYVDIVGGGFLSQRASSYVYSSYWGTYVTVYTTNAELAFRALGNADLNLPPMFIQAEAQIQNFNNTYVNGVVASQFAPYSSRPLNLAYGAMIGPSNFFSDGNDQMAKQRDGLGAETEGNWFPGPQTGYIGIRFSIGGTSTHYGWIQVEVDADADIGTNTAAASITIMDWAYEDTPDTPIMAGVSSGGGGGTTAVPTMSEWGLINLGLMLLTMGTLFIRRIREKLGLQVVEEKA